MNTAEKSYTTTTKLKGTERSYMSKHRSRFELSNGTDYTDDCCSLNDKQPIPVVPVNNKCGGRGMAIKMLNESKLPIIKCIDPNLDFSNSSIEHHFKKLQLDNKKKHMEKTEEKWMNRFSSKKS